MELTQTIEIITPDRARELLKMNTRNRPIVKANLTRLKSELESNRFKFNGDSIRISKSNVILDGQHRLLAVVSTGIPIKSVVITGLDDDIFDTIDQGTARTLAALIGMNQVGNYTICASMSVLLMKYEKTGTVVGGGAAESKPVLIAYFNANKNNITASASYVAGSQSLKRWLSPSYLGFLHFTLSKIDAELSIDFLNKIETGVGINDDSVEFFLRERLIRIATSVKKESPAHRAAYVIKVWNAMRDGKKIRLLRWNQIGDSAEDFPVAR